MPRIERVPTIAHIGLKPSTKVHRCRVAGHADITEIAGTIAGWDIDTATQSNGEMSEIAAHSDSFFVSLGGCPVVARMFEPIQDGRICIEVINARLLFGHKATGPELRAGIGYAKDRKWLDEHENGTYMKILQAGRQRSVRMTPVTAVRRAH